MISDEDKKRRRVNKRLNFSLILPVLYSDNNRNITYKTIQEFLDDLEQVNIEVTILKDLLEKEGYEDIQLQYSQKGYGQEKDQVYFSASVLESDAQYNARVNQAEKQALIAEKRKLAQEKKEKETLAKLKDKYKA